MKKKVLLLIIFIAAGIWQLVQAQTVIQTWATLGSVYDQISPIAIAIDASGNVYTANANSNTVSKMTASGVVTPAWAILAFDASPHGIAIDASGSVYTANLYNNTVSKITASGVVTQAWATLSPYAEPWGIAIDASGNVYTANHFNNTVSKITAAGVVTQAWATLASGTSPRAIAIDASGNVYTANHYNNTVSKITVAGVVTQAWATLASGTYPIAIAIDTLGNVYTANLGNNTVSKITAAGVVTQAWATLENGFRIVSPIAITIDASGNVYTANSGNNTVSKITAAGVVTQEWAPLAFDARPYAIAIDASGNVYTANSGNNTVSKIIPLGGQVPTLTTTTVNSITNTTAFSGGSGINANGLTVTSKGICWDTLPNPTIAKSHTSNGTGTANFTASLTNLIASKTYYVRAYATDSAGTGYGNQVTFTTLSNLPTLTTKAITSISYTTASSGGSSINGKGYTITVKGVCWDTLPNPTITKSHTSNGTGTANFTASLTNLIPGKTYYVRAYATNNVGTGYGNQVTFTTISNIPTLTTTAITSINYNYTTASSGGSSINGKGYTITVKGICWDTLPNPTIIKSHTSNGTGTGNFTASLINLKPGKTYYVRAYATTSKGTGYGNELSFTIPKLAITSIQQVTNTSATAYGDNGSSIIASTLGVKARGFCWDTTHSPTLTDRNVKSGTSVNVAKFNATLNSIIPGITYYVRAYIITTTPIDTFYSSELSFTPVNMPPAVTTAVVSNIANTSAKFIGNAITDTFGLAVTAKGICWDTTGNPTIADSKASGGRGSANFNISLSSLNAGTRYYARAYATTAAGTGYGNMVSFTTTKRLATIVIASAKAITSSRAEIYCTTINGYGSVVISKGVCWSTSPNPTIANSRTFNGVGIDNFKVSLTNLSVNTRYYIRAYVTTNTGTGYSTMVSFKLTSSGGMVTMSGTAPLVTDELLTNETLVEKQINDIPLKFNIYPNPATDKVTVQFSSLLNSNINKATIRLFNISGQLVKTVTQENVSNGNVVNIPVSDLVKGLYIIEVQTDKDKVVQRFIKN
jgi:streptogramin lyase